MSRIPRVLAWTFVGLVAVAPLSAAIYTVHLKNGATFESRFEPKDASYDSSKIVLVDETGLLISLAKDEVEDISSDFEAKGYGTMLDNTTMALGWAPNDAEVPEGEGGAAQGQSGAPAAENEPPLTIDQFVEPDQTQGLPGTLIGLGGDSLGGGAGAEGGQ